MSVKSYSSPLSLIKDNNGNTHPWYMSGSASIDAEGNVQVNTHLESHVDFSGFTGGIVVAFVNPDGQVVYSTPPQQYGVDGRSSFWGTRSPRDVKATFHASPNIYAQTYKITIFCFYWPKNRLAADFKQVWPDVIAVASWIWTNIVVPLLGSGSDDGDDVIVESNSDALESLPVKGHKLATPQLVSPANGTKLSNFPRSVTMTWAPVKDANAYIVTVQYLDAATGTWAAELSQYVLNVTSLVWTFRESSKGRWSVIACDSHNINTESDQSQWFTFDYTAAGGTAPIPVSPVAGAILSGPTVFSWKPVAGATQYYLEIQNDLGAIVDPVNPWRTIDSLSTTATSATVDLGPAVSMGVGGRWHVTASAPGGQGTSAWQDFKITFVAPKWYGSKRGR